MIVKVPVIFREWLFYNDAHLSWSAIVSFVKGCIIEEGFIQKTRQTVVVSVWGARSYAALGIFGLSVQYCVHSCCTFPFTFVGGWG